MSLSSTLRGLPGLASGVLVLLSSCGYDPLTCRERLEWCPGDEPEGVSPESGSAEQDVSDTGRRPGPLDASLTSDRSESDDDGAADAGPPCDVDASPSTTPCLIDDRYGVFVSANGSDAMTGQKRYPVKTLAAAVAIALRRERLRVYVCAETDGEITYFPDPVIIDENGRGARIYGGFRCSDWSYQPTVPTRVRVAPGLVPLTIAGASDVRIEDFVFEAADAVDEGGNSIAAFVSHASKVNLLRITFAAGAGKAGATPPLDSNYTGEFAPNGGDAERERGGAGCANACLSGVHSTGGRGGSVLASEDGMPPAGQDGEAGLPDLGASEPFDGKGGVAGTTCSNGHDGASAGAVGAGGLGALRFGTLRASGWLPASGSAGEPGGPGQGGGGGAGRVGATPGGGGGGACGGCGGAGGPGGQGGGSSFAFLSFQSDITFDNCALRAQSAGAGGRGGAGQRGQSGGDSGKQAGSACPGGMGGKGAAGGPGGGGAGGLSVGLGYVGSMPALLNSPPPQCGALAAAGGEPGEGGDPRRPAAKGVAGRLAPQLDLSDDPD